MSYAVASALQTAVFGQLTADAALSALVGDDIFDAPPAGTLPGLYVTLGPEVAEDAGDMTGRGAWHDFTISVVGDSCGFMQAKETAGAVSDALHGAALPLNRGTLVGLWFRKARAGIEKDGRRKIDLIFRARVEDVAP
jgi:hypothetical protein